MSYEIKLSYLACVFLMTRPFQWYHKSFFTSCFQRRARMIMVEGKLQSWGRALTVIKILDTDVAGGSLDATLEEIVEAVRNCGDRHSSLAYLQQMCQICFCPYPMGKVRQLWGPPQLPGLPTTDVPDLLLSLPHGQGKTTVGTVTAPWPTYNRCVRSASVPTPWAR